MASQNAFAGSTHTDAICEDSSLTPDENGLCTATTGATCADGSTPVNDICTATTGATCADGSTPVTVSYTHLTLPTTPYV